MILTDLWNSFQRLAEQHFVSSLIRNDVNKKTNLSLWTTSGSNLTSMKTIDRFDVLKRILPDQRVASPSCWAEWRTRVRRRWSSRGRWFVSAFCSVNQWIYTCKMIQLQRGCQLISKGSKQKVLICFRWIILRSENTILMSYLINQTALLRLIIQCLQKKSQTESLF